MALEFASTAMTTTKTDMRTGTIQRLLMRRI
jgi:hypothetical protein